jgi:hypothetical protein
MKMMGNTILVTGGTSGIGLGLALRFHQAGNKVIVAGRRKELPGQIAAGHDGVETLVLDVADPASIASSTPTSPRPCVQRWTGSVSPQADCGQRCATAARSPGRRRLRPVMAPSLPDPGRIAGVGKPGLRRRPVFPGRIPAWGTLTWCGNASLTPIRR